MHRFFMQIDGSSVNYPWALRLNVTQPFLVWLVPFYGLDFYTVWDAPTLSPIIAGSAGMADSGLQASFESEFCRCVAV